MIIKEIQKRTFIRPLFIWITENMLQALFDCRVVTLLSIIISFLVGDVYYLIRTVEYECGI